VRIFRRQAAVIDCFKSIDQFRVYTDAHLRQIARLAEKVKVGEGKILVREGQFGKEFFLILVGSVAVSRKGRLVNELGPGDFFGELVALNGGSRNATVTALSDLDLLIIGRREFNAMLQISEFRDALLKGMASRLQAVDARLATALHGHGGMGPDTARVDGPSTSFASFPRQIVTEAHYSEQL
jgi:CRP/FNR family transcriptional regulator, cyclic AMP receptor protein